jgi:hypothetical protein
MDECVVVVWSLSRNLPFQGEVVHNRKVGV